MADNFIANESGNIKVSEDVIATIASINAKEVEGILTVGSGSSWADILGGKKSATRGIKVELIEKGAIVDIHITIEFGRKVQEVAKTLQEKTKSAIETMTGLETVVVNVFVDGVAEKKEELEQEEAVEETKTDE